MLAIVIDCHDPDRLADFWAAALGYERFGSIDHYRSIRPADGHGPKVILQGVPEAKQGKNRVHLDLDLEPGADLGAEVARIEALGGSCVGEPVQAYGMVWQVMADPEGNELCVVVPG